VFNVTGNCWVDLGIVTLWDFLASKGEVRRGANFYEVEVNGVTIRLQPNLMMFEGDKGKIEDELSDARDWLRSEIWRETGKGRMLWSGVAWFFFRQHNNPDKFLLTPKELIQSGRYSSGRCDLCGRSDLKVRTAGTSENPFIVTADKMMTFYSYLRGEIKICANCAFASHFAAYGAIFYTRGAILNMFLMEGMDLTDLSMGLRGFSRLRAEAGYRNFESSIYNVQNCLEGFLDFLFTAWQKLGKMALLSDDLLKLSKKRFHIVQAELGPDKRTVMLKNYYLIPDVYHALRAFNVTEWKDKTEKLHNALHQVLNSFYFSRDREVDTFPREELSRCILYRSDIVDIMENFLYKYALVESKIMDGFSILNFYIFIERYEKEVVKVDEKVLESCRSLGRTLGDLAASTEDKGVLYSLRSTRNMDDFLGALHQVFTRYVDEIAVYRKGVDAILEEIEDTNWKKYRALVGIYAVLRYMEKRGKGGE